MPDQSLEDALAQLRADLAESIRQPEVAGLLDRARERRIRRRALTGVVAAVLAVSAAMPFLRVDPRIDPADPPPPPPATAPSLIQEVAFADATHGYALRAQCPTDGFCALTLLTTEDGETWTEVGEVPQDTAGTHGSISRLLVLGLEAVAVDWYRGDGTSVARQFSADGGQTWQAVPVRDTVDDVVPAIPDGAMLLDNCAGVDTGAACAGFSVVQPTTGASARLANAPELEHEQPGTIPTAAGHWWMAGREPGTSQPALSVSTDRGRTWTTTAIDAPSGWWQVVSEGGTLYASVTELPEHRLAAIFRSDDDGRTWTRTWQAGDGDLIETSSVPVAGTDGALSIEVTGPNASGYTSTDGGRTLIPTKATRLGTVTWTRAGYLAGAGHTFEMSPDGVHWRQFDIPMT